jgi:hypothetical protein
LIRGGARVARRVKKEAPIMTRLAQLASLSLVAAAALGSTPAFASPTVPAPAPETGPTSARDHRDEARPLVVIDAPPPRRRHRPGPGIMMPLKVDIGAQGANTTHGFLPGMELSAGIHWASLSPEPTNFDVGLGVFIAALQGPERVVGGDNDVVYGGAYLELGETLSHGDWWRTWASGRAEYLGTDAFGKQSTGFGVAGRLSAELYTSGVGIEPRGVFLGTYAIGVYTEVAARGLGDEVGEFQVSAGLTFRTPLVFEL